MVDRHYTAGMPFIAERVRAIVVHCSDGRYGAQIDEFLQQSLKLPRYDRLAIPGGAAALAGPMHAYAEAAALERQLRFLIETHELTRVILIAHHGCGFYEHAWLGGRTLVEQQQADLLAAADRLWGWYPRLRVDVFHACQIDGKVAFHCWPIVADEVAAPFTSLTAQY
jgi:hypothetical protein